MTLHAAQYVVSVAHIPRYCMSGNYVYAAKYETILQGTHLVKYRQYTKSSLLLVGHKSPEVDLQVVRVHLHLLQTILPKRPQSHTLQEGLKKHTLHMTHACPHACPIQSTENSMAHIFYVIHVMLMAHKYLCTRSHEGNSFRTP